MTILHLSDLHAAWHWFDWLGSAAVTADLTIVSGDLLLNAENQDLASQHERIVQWLPKMKGRRVVFCSGNHDTSQLVETLESAGFLVDGFNAAIDGAWLTIAPFRWDWDSDLNKDTYRALRAAAKKRERLPWIFATHRPPIGPLAEAAMFGGDDGLRRWMEDLPLRYVFSGHSHEAPMNSGTCFEQIGGGWAFNPGRASNDSPIPNFIFLDTKRDVGVWYTKGTERRLQLMR